MVLKIVKFLGQQGYGTDQIVILTPYLGQLRELQTGLRETNDPVLNDLDSHDLVRAGLVSESSAKLVKKPIRLATIGIFSYIFLYPRSQNSPPAQIITKAKSLT